MIEDQDRNSLGWQPWLTPRQTRIIFVALTSMDYWDSIEQPHVDKLIEWFQSELKDYD